LKKFEKIKEPLTIFINFQQDDKIIYNIYDIVSQNQGKRKIKFMIKSKLGDVEIGSTFHINNRVEEMLKKLDGIFLE